MTYTPSTKPNTRIDVADILRGIAIAGIILIHFLEHMNFFLFPEPKNEFWASINTAVWDSTFFLLAGKMYAIFAMLFGLSFYIQHDNQAQKGIDFRPRFIWRMILLMLFGLFDLLFYNGDILFLYAVCGLLIIPLIRASNKVIWFFLILMLMQPVELVYLIMGLIDPSTSVLDLGSSNYYGALIWSQSEGNIIDVAIAGIKYGLPANFLWAIENGRMTQTVLRRRQQRQYMEKDLHRIHLRLCRTSPALPVPAESYGHQMRIQQSECSSEHVEEHLDDDVHRIRSHPALLQDFCKVMAPQDSAIRKDEPDQLPRPVDHRSHYLLQLGIRTLQSMRTYRKLRSWNMLHHRTVHLLHMVDEAPQERTFRTALVHSYMVWKEIKSIG